MDLASILAKIQSLEKEKSDMRSQLEVATLRLSKLQESKRAEMEQMMNSTITNDILLFLTPTLVGMSR